MSKILQIAFWLLATNTLSAQIRSLDGGSDLNHAVNPTDLVLAYGSGGDQGLQVYGIDGLKHTLVRAPIDTPSFVGQATVLMEDISAESHLLIADVDKDMRNDAVLVSGHQGFVWKSGSTASDTDVPHSFELPAAAFTRYPSNPPLVADFDGDGADDLLVPPPPSLSFPPMEIPSIAESPGWIIFSFATTAAETVPLPTTRVAATTTAEPFETGGNPVIALSADSTTEILSCNAAREISLLETIPFPGLIAELDGVAPPELIDASSLFVDGRLTIRKQIEGAWTILAELSADIPITFGATTSAIADFDNDGRQELVLNSSLYLPFGSFTADPQPLLVEFDAESQATTRPLPGFAFQLASIKPLPLRNQPAMLAGFGPSRVFYDLLGNPTTLAGGGLIGIMRNRPLFPGLPNDFQPFGADRPIDAVIGKLNSDASPEVGIISNQGVFSSLSPDLEIEPVRRSFPTTITADSLLLTDFNGDQIGDPAVARTGLFSAFRSVPGTDPQQFNSNPSLFLASSGFNPDAPTRMLATADFDLDGDMDLLAIRPSDETLGWIEISDPNALVAFHPIIAAGRVFRSGGIFGGGGLGNGSVPGYQWIEKAQTVVLDIDGDSDPDIISMPSALGNRPALHRNTSVGFSIEAFADLPDPDPLNPIQDPSFPKLFTGSFTNNSNDQEVVILRSSFDFLGNRTFPLQFLIAESAPDESVSLTDAELAAAVDFDADGFTDFITASGPGTDILGNPTGHTGLYFHRNRGDGTFDEAIGLTEPAEFISRILSGDFNADSLPDIVTISEETGIVRLLTQELLDPLPGFNEWATAHELTDLTPDGDPDRDGVATIIEYVSGTHPGIAGASSTLFPPPPLPPTITFPQNTFSPLRAMIHRPRQPQSETIRIGFEYSTDLDIWSEADATSATPSPSHPLWETLHWNVPNGPGFRRFRVEPSTP